MDQAVCQTVTRMYGRGALEARQEVKAPRGTPDMKSARREPAAAAVQTVGPCPEASHARRTSSPLTGEADVDPKK